MAKIYMDSFDGYLQILCFSEDRRKRVKGAYYGNIMDSYDRPCTCYGFYYKFSFGDEVGSRFYTESFIDLFKELIVRSYECYMEIAIFNVNGVTFIFRE